MNIVELIGFVITLLALSILYWKRLAEEKARREHPEEFEQELEEEEEALQAIQKLLGIEEKKKVIEKPPVYQKVVKNRPQRPPLPKQELPLRPYRIIKQKNSRAAELIHSLKSPKEMILLHEIIDRPKALRNERF